MSAHAFTHSVRLVIAAAALLASPAALADSWSWKIDGLPASGDCWDKAAEIGSRFQSVTGIRPTDVRCSAITAEAFDILLEYESESRLPLLSTRGSSRGSVGQFQTLEECRATLGRATASFKTNTGLEPITADCHKDTFVRTHQWGWRIESFGNAAKKPFIESELILEDPASMTWRDLGLSLRTALSERGIQTEFMSFRGNGPVERRVTMLYYAADSFDLNNVQHGRYDSQEDCFEELPHVSSTLTIGRPLVTLCSSAGVGGTHYIMGFWMNGPGTRQVSSPENWPTLKECRANLDAIVEAWRARGQDVKGAFCAKPEDAFSDGENYRVQLVFSQTRN
jgi:hypothetical protein